MLTPSVSLSCQPLGRLTLLFLHCMERLKSLNNWTHKMNIFYPPLYMGLRWVRLTKNHRSKLSQRICCLHFMFSVLDLQYTLNCILEWLYDFFSYPGMANRGCGTQPCRCNTCWKVCVPLSWYSSWPWHLPGIIVLLADCELLCRLFTYYSIAVCHFGCKYCMCMSNMS